jgi:hypothetical protein
MELEEIAERLKSIEGGLGEAPWTLVHSFERDRRVLHVAVTERLRKAARKEGVWRSREMLTALKNAAYGFDEQRARSVGGRDGLFLLDRTFRPPNEMMRKIFDRYLDRAGSGAQEVAASLEVSLGDLLPVRLVSHHLRLLGVLARREDADWLILVDCDRTS